MEAEAGQTTEARITEMIRRIAEGFQPDKIIVFGSRARGTAGPDSDVDFLVVMPVKGSRRHQAIEIEMRLGGLGLSKDVIIVTPEEFTAYRDVVGSIAYPAAHEGRVVYERSA